MTTTEAALREIERRVRAVANLWHNSEQWHSEDAADIVAGAEGTAWDWIFQDVRAALSQPSPASSTAGEARAILDRVPVSEFPGKSYEDRLANARKVYAALSPSSGEPASVAVEAERPDDWLSSLPQELRDCVKTTDLRALSKPTPVEAGALLRRAFPLVNRVAIHPDEIVKAERLRAEIAAALSETLPVEREV